MLQDLPPHNNLLQITASDKFSKVETRPVLFNIYNFWNLNKQRPSLPIIALIDPSPFVWQAHFSCLSVSSPMNGTDLEMKRCFSFEAPGLSFGCERHFLEWRSLNPACIPRLGMYAEFNDIGANIYIYTFIGRNRHQNAPKTLVGTNYPINCYLLYIFNSIFGSNLFAIFFQT